jgi:hypothetical protein
MALDFDRVGRGRRHGVWLLECDRDLTASVTAALLLYVNETHPDIQNLLASPSDPAARALADFISSDVTRQLILRAIQHDELEDGHDYGEGTLGDLFLTLLRSHLPGRSLDQVRREFQDDPGEIEAELLSYSWRTSLQ